MPFLSMGGARISYSDHGRGEAVFLVHGWIGSGALWSLMTPWLSERFRVVAPDLPGHADSDIPEGFAFTLEGFSAFLEDMRQELGLERVSLVGHSMGGCICVHYAASHPDAVERLALISTPGSAGALGWQARLPFAHRLAGLAYPLWGPRMAASLIKSSVRHPDKLPPDFLEGAVMQASLLRREALVGTTRMLGKLDLGPELAAIKAPVLIVQGDHDPSVKPSESERLGGVLDGARLHAIPDCGHCPNYAYPHLVVGLVEDFVRGVV